MNQPQTGKLSRHQAEVVEVISNYGHPIRERACGGPHVINATTFEAISEPLIESCPLFNNVGVRHQYNKPSQGRIEGYGPSFADTCD